MWKYYLSIICFYAAIISTPGDARTYTVRSNDCAKSATLPLVIAGGNVVAVDLNRGRAFAEDVVVIYDRRYDGWASQRLFSRFVLDPESGEALGKNIKDADLEARLCGAGSR